MLSTNDTQLVVLDYYGVDPDLLEWLKGREWYRASEAIGPLADNTPCHLFRNSIAPWFLGLNPPRPFLCMIDDDTIPLPLTEALFVTEAPVAGAHYWARCGGLAHGADGVVGCGIIRIHRRVLEAVGPDPFTPTPDDPCECVAFARRCQSVGFNPIHVGFAAHRIPALIVPTGPTECEVRFTQSACGDRRPLIHPERRRAP